MADKQVAARSHTAAAFEDALQGVCDVIQLWPHTGLPVYPEMVDELCDAKAALVAARAMFAKLVEREKADG